MKISTKTSYGLRAMIHLAEQGSDQICSLKEISEQKDISFDFLEKIMAELREAGLVKSHRGAQGGYSLTEPPKEIEVGRIIKTLEGTELIECVAEGESCPRQKSCLAKDVWRELQQVLDQALNSITLEDLIS